MSDQPSRYEQRGVSASKQEVHEAIKDLDKGLFPLAFCKVLPDIVGGDPAFCNMMHADTAGTKTSLAYLYWRETGDESVWADIVQDAIVMNVDDMACTGCTDGIVLSSTIGRNKNLIPGRVVIQLIAGTAAFIDNMTAWGVSMFLAGGETADVGDIVRTLDVGFTAFARMRRDQVLVNAIQPGDIILALASDGTCRYDTRYNTGMGSNGLTMARHDVLASHYAKAYPESFDPANAREFIYTGPHTLSDRVVLDGQEWTVGKALLSPTRTYLPALKAIFAGGLEGIHGAIHCTGGGQTKVLKFIDGRRVVKDRLMPVPALFHLIQQASGTSWREMYEVFNMGHRLELYLAPSRADQVLQVAQDMGFRAQVIGHVQTSDVNEVVVDAPMGTFEYR